MGSEASSDAHIKDVVHKLYEILQGVKTANGLTALSIVVSTIIFESAEEVEKGSPRMLAANQGAYVFYKSIKKTLTQLLLVLNDSNDKPKNDEFDDESLEECHGDYHSNTCVRTKHIEGLICEATKGHKLNEVVSVMVKLLKECIAESEGAESLAQRVSKFIADGSYDNSTNQSVTKH